MLYCFLDYVLPHSQEDDDYLGPRLPIEVHVLVGHQVVVVFQDIGKDECLIKVSHARECHAEMADQSP